LFSLLAVVASIVSSSARAAEPAATAAEENPVLNFQVKSLAGKDVDLKD
jgi:hypothetical protein